MAQKKGHESAKNLVEKKSCTIQCLPVSVLPILLNIVHIFILQQKSDPAQFLRIYGRPTKIHLDSAIAYAAEAPQSM